MFNLNTFGITNTKITRSIDKEDNVTMQ